MCGAAYLSASGAFAVGIGMVKIVTAEENRIPLQTMLPEAMLDCGDDFAKDLDCNDLATVRISTFCIAMLSNNSF